MLDFAVIFGIIIFAVERTDTQQYRSGHNEHDWKSCGRVERPEGSNPSHSAKSSEHFGSMGEKPSDFKVFGIFYGRKFSKYSMAQ